MSAHDRKIKYNDSFSDLSGPTYGLGRLKRGKI
jgi:hypothetical protein